MLYQTFDELAEYLLEDCTTDLEKVRALFIFTTSLDINKIQETLQKLPEQGTPLDYLLKIHWQMGNHAHFFAQLARQELFVLTGLTYAMPGTKIILFQLYLESQEKTTFS